MARKRSYGHEHRYGEAHRESLPELYGRIGHRLDMLDRDWLEFCHHCKQPIFAQEEARDVGQNLLEKSVRVTRNLAVRANVPAVALFWRIDRPSAVQERIDRLNRELIALQTQHPITGFTARVIHVPGRDARRGLVDLTPKQWWEEGVLFMHRQHHLSCTVAQRNGEHPVDPWRLSDARIQSRLWSPEGQGALL